MVSSLRKGQDDPSIRCRIESEGIRISLQGVSLDQNTAPALRSLSLCGARPQPDHNPTTPTIALLKHGRPWTRDDKSPVITSQSVTQINRWLPIRKRICWRICPVSCYSAQATGAMELRPPPATPNVAPGSLLVAPGGALN